MEALTIYDILDEMNVQYQEYTHPAVYTCEESDKYYGDIPGGRSKNLFLRNRKGDRHYLVIVPPEKRVDLKEIAKDLGQSKISFASEERLMKYLGVTPGSVTPFGVIHDEENNVKIVVDATVWRYDTLHFHPCKNTATLVVSHADFETFLSKSGNEWEVMEV